MLSNVNARIRAPRRHANAHMNATLATRRGAIELIIICGATCARPDMTIIQAGHHVNVPRMRSVLVGVGHDYELQVNCKASQLQCVVSSVIREPECRMGDAQCLLDNCQSEHIVCSKSPRLIVLCCLIVRIFRLQPECVDLILKWRSLLDTWTNQHGGDTRYSIKHIVSIYTHKSSSPFKSGWLL